MKKMGISATRNFILGVIGLRRRLALVLVVRGETEL